MGSSPLLKSRQKAEIVLPDVLKNIHLLTFSKLSSTESLGDREEIKKHFSNTYGQSLLKGKVTKKSETKPIKIGVVLSGGQAAGGHNVIIGLFDSLRQLHQKSSLIGFLGGPSGIFKGKYKELTEEMLAEYRNTGGFDLIGSGRDKIETEEQLESSLKIAKQLGLDGIVIIGGDDSNTNAAVLAEYFLKNKTQIKVIGVPKTIDGDLKNDFVEISFGFDTACKTYSEMIGNLARDSLSAKKYTHFVKLMGRSASHIALECALQTHPNLTFIAEEVFEKKQTVKDLTNEIADLLQLRSEQGKNYGVILIPEGLIELIEEMKILISEVNEKLASAEFVKGLAPVEILEKVKKTLKKTTLETFEFLPEEIQHQLLLDRDPHGNVQVALINTEKLFIETVTKELKKRDYKGKFVPVSHFFGYEGRSGFPTVFDATYCYALGFSATCLIKEGYTGYMACVTDLIAPVKNWQVMGIPLTSLMHLEERKGKLKPVIKKALVDLKGLSFKIFKSRREEWKLEDDYCFPGPIQFFGDNSITDQLPMSLQFK